MHLDVLVRPGTAGGAERLGAATIWGTGLYMWVCPSTAAQLYRIPARFRDAVDKRRRPAADRRPGVKAGLIQALDGYTAI